MLEGQQGWDASVESRQLRKNEARELPREDRAWSITLSFLGAVNRMNRKVEPKNKMIQRVLRYVGNYRAINQVVTIHKIGYSGIS